MLLTNRRGAWASSQYSIGAVATRQGRSSKVLARASEAPRAGPEPSSAKANYRT